MSNPIDIRMGELITRNSNADTLPRTASFPPLYEDAILNSSDTPEPSVVIHV